MTVENPEKGGLDRWKNNFMILVVIIHCIANITYCGLGVFIIVDKPAACEQTYHMKKYSTLSIVFNFMAFLSFFVFSRIKCKDSVRARATAVLILHLAFTAWGLLTWRKLDAQCQDANDPVFLGFHHATVLWNGMYFFFYAIHEVCPPKADWTVCPWFGPKIIDVTTRNKYTNVQYTNSVFQSPAMGPKGGSYPGAGTPNVPPLPPYPDSGSPEALVFDPLAMGKLSDSTDNVHLAVEGGEPNRFGQKREQNKQRFLETP